MHHNKGKLHDSTSEILLLCTWELGYKVETTLSVVEGERELVNANY
jgi:hypothetical protein